jgi:phosphotriesterase-related protein
MAASADQDGKGPYSLVPTFLGPVEAAALGLTLMHEHVFVRDLELEQNLVAVGWDRVAMVERAVTELTELHRSGVSTVVDLTVVGLGRDVSLMADVAARVPLNLVAATGIYAAEALPPYFELHGPGRLVDEPEPLTDLFVRDIEVGIGGTDIRAGLIKVRSVGPALSEVEERVMAAAAAAHARTGVAITTHSVPRLRNGLAQQAFLRARGVPAERIVIGHSGDTADLDYLRAIMDAGSTIGLDRFGMEYVLDDESRIDTVVELVRLGYAERMVLSHDAAVFSHVTPPAWRARQAPHWRMDHLLRHIVPELRHRGVTEADIETMLVANPRRLLTSRGARDPMTSSHRARRTGAGTC